MFPLVARTLEVVAVDDASPWLRRVALAGADLDGFPQDLGPADHVKVFFPADGTGSTSAEGLPVVEGGRWSNRGDAGLTFRDYTVRAGREGRSELVLEFVVHDHGVAGRWASQAAPGQVLGVLGPRGSAPAPRDRDRYLLVADESGVPALANWLELLPATVTGAAFAEVAGGAGGIRLVAPPGLEVTWLSRRLEPAGASTVLADAVLAWLEADKDGPVSRWAWVGCEYTAARTIRRALRAARAWGPGTMDVSGYWRRGTENFDHHASLD